MHTIQLILVEANSAEDAFAQVETELTSDDAVSWSDWHEATDASSMNFAGRWSNQLFLTAEQKQQIADGTLDKSTIPNHLCYADDPELAEKVISEFVEYRKSAMRENIPTTHKDYSAVVSNYSPNDPEGFDAELWKLSKLLRLLSGEWFYETFLWDVSAGTASLNYFLERCAKNPEKQFLIPVDFHH